MRGHSSASLIAAALCVCSATFVGWASASLEPSEFYIVSVGFSDAKPGWHRSVLEVVQDGSDMLVRYIRVIAASGYCGNPTQIVATTMRLPNTSPRRISGGLNLCAIDSPVLSRTIRAFPTTQYASVFAGDQHAIVAKCGTETRVISLPGDWTIDMARLKRKQPRIAGLWTLEKAVGTQAFGRFPSIDIVPPEMAARLQAANETILAELKSGKFDAGLASLAPRSFKDDVEALRSESDVPEFRVKLANAEHFRFDRFVDPQYPPLAKQARISGAVELELTSNPASGEIEQVTVVSGHPLLVLPAKESAQHWRFVPGTDTASHTTRVILEFVSQEGAAVKVTWENESIQCTQTDNVCVGTVTENGNPDYKLTPNEIALVLGTAIQYDVAEVVDPLVHVVARIDKKALAGLGTNQK